MSKFLRISAGFLISAGCLWFVFQGFDFAQLRQAIATASYGWFLPALLIFLLNTMARSLRWKILLSPVKKISLWTVAPALVMGFFMNNILPARGGELVRAVTLSKKTNVPLTSVLGSIVAERLTDMLGLLMIVLLASRMLPWDKLPVLPIVGVVVAGFGGCFAVFLFAKHSHSFIEKCPPLIKKVIVLVQQLTEGFLVLKSFSKIAMVLILSAFIWVGELLIALSVSRTVALDLGFFESAALLTGLSVGVMIPAAPGYVGTYEFFGKSVLVLLGKPDAASLGYVLILHFYQLLLIALAALPSFFILSKTSEENA